MRSLIRSADLSADDIVTLLDLATEFTRVPMQHHDLLDGAIHRSDGDTTAVGPADLQLGLLARRLMGRVISPEIASYRAVR